MSLIYQHRFINYKTISFSFIVARLELVFLSVSNSGQILYDAEGGETFEVVLHFNLELSHSLAVLRALIVPV